MYFINVFFPWFPRNYDYVSSILEVFNISADQLVSVQNDLDHNILIFSVASAEVFTRLQQFFCRVLFFPIEGRNILECFAYPQSPQYRFTKISAYPASFLRDKLDRCLSGLGTVLYHQYICQEAPLTAEYRSDTIGVVTLDQRAKQCPAGDGKHVKPAVRAVPYVAAPVTGGAAFFTLAGGSSVALQTFPVPGYLQQQGTVQQPSVYLYPFQGQVFGFNDGNLRRYSAPYGNQNCPKMGVFSPAKDAAEEKCGDGCPSEDPSSEDQYEEPSSDEGEEEKQNKEE